MQQQFWPVHESAYRQKKSYFVHIYVRFLCLKKFLWKHFLLLPVTYMRVCLVLNEIIIVRFHKKYSSVSSMYNKQILNFNWNWLDCSIHVQFTGNIFRDSTWNIFCFHSWLGVQVLATGNFELTCTCTTTKHLRFVYWPKTIDHKCDFEGMFWNLRFLGSARIYWKHISKRDA